MTKQAMEFLTPEEAAIQQEMDEEQVTLETMTGGKDDVDETNTEGKTAGEEQTTQATGDEAKTGDEGKTGDEAKTTDDGKAPETTTGEEATTTTTEEEPKLPAVHAVVHAEPVADLEAKLKEISDAKEALDKKLDDGELTTAEWRKEQEKLSDQAADLKAQQREYELAERTNAKNAEEQWKTTCDQFLDQYQEFQKPGLKAALDANLKALVNEGKTESKSMWWHLAEARRRTLAELGLEDTTTGKEAKGEGDGKKPADTKPPARTRPAAPVANLHQAPSAVRSDTGTDEFAHIDKLSGIDQEAAVAALERRDPSAYQRWLAGQ